MEKIKYRQPVTHGGGGMMVSPFIERTGEKKIFFYIYFITFPILFNHLLHSPAADFYILMIVYNFGLKSPFVYNRKSS